MNYQAFQAKKWEEPTDSVLRHGLCHHPKHTTFIYFLFTRVWLWNILFSSPSDEPADERIGRKKKRGRGAADQDDRDFGAFLQHFPATASSTPPTKKKRTAAGFPPDRVFYDRWRSVQFAKREEHLLCKLTHFIIQKNDYTSWCSGNYARRLG